MRRTVPLVPAIVFGFAVVVLAVGVTDWLRDRGHPPGSVDIGFYDDMTVHHFQAIDMSRTYMENGADSHLKSVAGEIDFSQAGDIRVMQEALAEWDEIGTPDQAMEWMGHAVPTNDMPGLATNREMAELSTATGAELDDLFTRLMIDHHAGGAEMALVAADEAELPEVRRLAELMAATQLREIDELNARRVALDLPIHEPDP